MYRILKFNINFRYLILLRILKLLQQTKLMDHLTSCQLLFYLFRIGFWIVSRCFWMTSSFGSNLAICSYLKIFLLNPVSLEWQLGLSIITLNDAVFCSRLSYGIFHLYQFLLRYHSCSWSYSFLGNLLRKSWLLSCLISHYYYWCSSSEIFISWFLIIIIFCFL